MGKDVILPVHRQLIYCVEFQYVKERRFGVLFDLLVQIMFIDNKKL